MSFAIDEDMVVELLKSEGTGYAVSVSSIEPSIENYTPYYAHMLASGTVNADRGVVAAQDRGHLMAVREKIEKSGMPLKGTAELNREIEEMRGVIR